MSANENKQGLWKRIFKATGGPIAMKVVIVVLALFWLMVVAASWAESAETPSSGQKDAVASRAPASLDDGDSGYDFNWLDKDKKIYVLQNRRYTKAGHVFLSLMGGPGLSNPYLTAWNLDPRISYYFSEAFGIEAFYGFTFNAPNNTLTALANTTPTTVPVIREFKNELGLMAQWVPWYAKINMFNKILYFDWYLQAGMGQLATQIQTQTNTQLPPSFTSQNLFALYVGTGHIYHVSDDFIVRADFTGSYYHAPLQGNAGSNTWFSNYNFELGIGYRL